jgi:hypothetical protein
VYEVAPVRSSETAGQAGRQEGMQVGRRQAERRQAYGHKDRHGQTDRQTDRRACSQSDRRTNRAEMKVPSYNFAKIKFREISSTLKKRQTSFVGSKSFVYAKVFYFLQQFF